MEKPWMDNRPWIKGAIQHPGALHDDLGVPQGQPIPDAMIQAAESKPGVVGQRARLAATLKGMSKKKASLKRKKA